MPFLQLLSGVFLDGILQIFVLLPFYQNRFEHVLRFNLLIKKKVLKIGNARDFFIQIFNAEAMPRKMEIHFSIVYEYIDAANASRCKVRCFYGGRITILVSANENST